MTAKNSCKFFCLELFSIEIFENFLLIFNAEEEPKLEKIKNLKKNSKKTRRYIENKHKNHKKSVKNNKELQIEVEFSLIKPKRKTGKNKFVNFSNTPTKKNIYTHITPQTHIQSTIPPHTKHHKHTYRASKTHIPTPTENQKINAVTYIHLISNLIFPLFQFFCLS